MNEPRALRDLPASLAVLGEPERAVVLLDPVRRRLVRALRERADSASGLARRLGESRQRLNYHLRALEDAGLVVLEEERRRGNFVERVLRPTARHYLIDPTLADDPRTLETAGDRFSATWLIALAARAIREVAALREKAAASGRRLATATVETEVRLARPADFQAFASDLAEAVARVVERHHDEKAPGGRRFRVVLGAWPSPSRIASARTRRRAEHPSDPKEEP